MRAIPTTLSALLAAVAFGRHHNSLSRCLLLALVSLVAVSVALALTWPSVEATGEASGQPTAVTLPWVHQHQGAGNRPPIPLTRIGFVAWITTQVLRARRRPKSVGEVMSA